MIILEATISHKGGKGVIHTPRYLKGEASSLKVLNTVSHRVNSTRILFSAQWKLRDASEATRM